MTVTRGCGRLSDRRLDASYYAGAWRLFTVSQPRFVHPTKRIDEDDIAKVSSCIQPLQITY